MAREKIVHVHDAQALEGTATTFRRIEIASILAFPVLFLWLAARTWHALLTPSILLLGFVTGALMADFISGIFHWFFDTWFTPTTPYIGHTFVRTFRQHHIDPTAICRHDFIETNGSNILAGGFLCVVGQFADEAWVAASLLFAGLFMSATSQIHKWAHAESVPRIVTLMQRVRLILPKSVHVRHHVAPFDRAYCITTGWLNATLHHIRFFRFLERVILMTTGALPRRDDIGEEAAKESVGDDMDGNAGVVVAATQQGFVHESARDE